MSSDDINVYRQLQQHLDQLPIGFPPSKSGVEIRMLKYLFTPQEAKIATKLKFSWDNTEPLEKIYERIKPLGYSMEELEKHLENMVKKGTIMAHRKGDKKSYGNAMFIIGIFEFQLNKLTKEFVNDMHQYMWETWIPGLANIPIPQTRLIPIEQSVTPELGISNYDVLKEVINSSEGPFSLVECVCRQGKDLLGEPCKVTSRREICIGFGPWIQVGLDMGNGKEITKEEALEHLQKNQEEGLIFQLNNAQKPDFVCSCCSCCCEGIATINKFPNPSELIATNYYAEVDSDLCTGCGTCSDICQMGAITLENDMSTVNRVRCIGCGNCVAVCPSEALKLYKKEKQTVPPLTAVELYEEYLKIKTKLKEKELRRKQRLEKRKQRS
ncbi:MAG: ATP-binding protein [Promethearchaeota archaeon]